MNELLYYTFSVSAVGDFAPVSNRSACFTSHFSHSQTNLWSNHQALDDLAQTRCKQNALNNAKCLVFPEGAGSPHSTPVYGELIPNWDTCAAMRWVPGKTFNQEGKLWYTRLSTQRTSFAARAGSFTISVHQYLLFSVSDSGKWKKSAAVGSISNWFVDAALLFRLYSGERISSSAWRVKLSWSWTSYVNLYMLKWPCFPPANHNYETATAHICVSNYEWTQAWHALG